MVKIEEEPIKLNIEYSYFVPYSDCASDCVCDDTSMLFSDDDKCGYWYVYSDDEIKQQINNNYTKEELVDLVFTLKEQNSFYYNQYSFWKRQQDYVKNIKSFISNNTIEGRTNQIKARWDYEKILVNLFIGFGYDYNEARKITEFVYKNAFKPLKKGHIEEYTLINILGNIALTCLISIQEKSYDFECVLSEILDFRRSVGSYKSNFNKCKKD